MYIFCYTYEAHLGNYDILSQAFQTKSQISTNAMDMINANEQKLQTFRLECLDSLTKATSFCEKLEIEMDDDHFDPKYKRKKTNIVNSYYP